MFANSETFGTADLPQDLRENIVREIGVFAVGLLGVRSVQGNDVLQLYGCGTLVTVADNYYILTAEHVWAAARSARTINLAIVENYDHNVPIDPQMLTAITAARRESDEWGPDLTFIRIPPEIVGGIKARKSF